MLGPRRIMSGARAHLKRWLGLSGPDMRSLIAGRYLAGDGIEIGALHQPLRVPRAARVRYVDRLDTAALRARYPELANDPLVNVDVVDNGETLGTFAAASLDFVIANHFIEHTQDPLGAIANFLRVLKPGGRVYMAVPDKRWTFDAARSVTPLEHTYRDHAEGPAWSREGHYREWCEKVNKTSGAMLEQEVRHLMNIDYSIHFHVWSQDDFLEMLLDARRRLKLPFEIAVVLEHRERCETICILVRK